MQLFGSLPGRFPGPMGRASLKVGIVWNVSLGRVEISRPYGPGLIEGILDSDTMLSSPMISRPYGPGLIEGRREGRMDLPLRQISRPYGPGLIEGPSKPFPSRSQWT